MREIKFRAWDKEAEEFVFSDATHDFCWFQFEDPKGLKAFTVRDAGRVDLDGAPILNSDELEPVQQYTGLKDKNGNEIYEGDIVQDESIFRAPFWQYKIAWNDSKAGWLAFPLDDANYGFGLSVEGAKTLEVIGNIYETK